MTRVLVSGGTGYVGSFLVQHFLDCGHEVTVAARRVPPQGMFRGVAGFRPLDLEDPKDPSLFEGMDWFVHAALDHLPEKYRGGEGSDPEGFRRRNLDGSVVLFELARQCGVGKVVFLSSRAVYGTQAPGMVLTEETPPRPDTLYGAVKLAAEQALLDMAGPSFCPLVLRVTGVYGTAPGGRDKWAALIGDFLAGRRIEPRAATEVHGRDVAGAAAMLLGDDIPAGVFNVSDMVVDRREVLAIAHASGPGLALPERADAAGLNVMSTEKLRALGWKPGGRALLEASVRSLCGSLPAPERG